MKTDILDQYVCTNPFRYMDLQSEGNYVCCPSWVPTIIGKREDDALGWKSSEAQSIRDAVMDGSYSKCNKQVCPSLNKLINTGVVEANFIKKADFIASGEHLNPQVREVLYGFDRSCNLACPSCRATPTYNDDVDSEEHYIKIDTMDAIEAWFAPTIKTMMITGSGDPFFSKVYRDYLMNFDRTLYPDLESIRLITNGNLLNEKMWSNMKAAPMVDFIEVSVDAGTKETYEGVTRLGGNWDTLIDNLKFISTITTVSNLMISMVVSKHNFREMKLFYDLMASIFAKSSFKLTLNFRQIVYWNASAYSPLSIRELQCFDHGHPDFDAFMEELAKIHNIRYVNHNFHHLIK